MVKGGGVGVLPLLLAKISRVLLAAWRLTSSLHGSFNPHLLLSFQEMITEFCPTHDWPNSPVRCLAWHPHTAKLAVALQDDSIHVHTSHQLVKPVLKHAGQRAVNCMAWKPCGASELASPHRQARRGPTGRLHPRPHLPPARQAGPQARGPEGCQLYGLETMRCE